MHPIEVQPLNGEIMRHSLPIELEGAVQLRVHFDKKSNRWIVRVNDKIGLVKEFQCDTEPYMMVYMQEDIGEKPIMRTFPTDEVAKYKKEFSSTSVHF